MLLPKKEKKREEKWNAKEKSHFKATDQRKGLLYSSTVY